MATQRGSTVSAFCELSNSSVRDNILLSLSGVPGTHKLHLSPISTCECVDVCLCVTVSVGGCGCECIYSGSEDVGLKYCLKKIRIMERNTG